jgi:hypothetical protein
MDKRSDATSETSEEDEMSTKTQEEGSTERAMDSILSRGLSRLKNESGGVAGSVVCGVLGLFLGGCGISGFFQPDTRHDPAAMIFAAVFLIALGVALLVTAFVIFDPDDGSASSSSHQKRNGYSVPPPYNRAWPKEFLDYFERSGRRPWN